MTSEMDDDRRQQHSHPIIIFHPNVSAPHQMFWKMNETIVFQNLAIFL